jgi:DNA gyrase/topoisomerase IV subunit A
VEAVKELADREHASASGLSHDAVESRHRQLQALADQHKEMLSSQQMMISALENRITSIQTEFHEERIDTSVHAPVQAVQAIVDQQKEMLSSQNSMISALEDRVNTLQTVLVIMASIIASFSVAVAAYFVLVASKSNLEKTHITNT